MNEDEELFKNWLEQNDIFDKDNKKYRKNRKKKRNTQSQNNDNYKAFESLDSSKYTDKTSSEKEFQEKKKSNQSEEDEFYFNKFKTLDKKDKELFEKWIEEGQIYDKDLQKNKNKQNNKAKKNNDFFGDLNIDDYPENHNNPNKFYIEDKELFEKWLARNDVPNKDSEIVERNVYKYPPKKNMKVIIDSMIDLHNLNVSNALFMLDKYLKTSFDKNETVVLVIHGKGLHSKGEAKLKKAVRKYLKREGKAYCFFFRDADKRHGGKGATYCWLK